MYVSLDCHRAAFPLAEEVLSCRKEAVGETMDADTILVMRRVASILLNLDNFGATEPLSRKIPQKSERLPNAADPDLVASVKILHGACLTGMG